MNIINKVRSRTNNLFYGWRVVAAGSFLYGQGSGTVFYGFSAFFNPLMNEFGWTRALLAGVISMSRLEGGIEGLIVGPLIDRFGARKIAIIGIIWAGLGFFTMLFVTENILSLYLIFGILISIGYNAGFARPADTAAAKWFIKKRGLALSFVTTGAGVGAVIILPLLAWIVTQFGWRTASICIGFFMLTCGLPAAYFMRSTPEEMGFRPDGEVVASATKVIADDNIGEVNFTVREALATSAFWIYIIGMMFRGTVFSTIVVHQIPHLVDIGIDYQIATNVLGQMVFVSIVGRLGLGWLSDKFDKRIILFACCLLQAIGIWIFINAFTVEILYMYVVVYGIGYGGTFPLTHALRADLFGRKTFATMLGITTVITILPTVAAPVLIGHLYDLTQSYTISFYAIIIASLLAGFAFLAIRKPKPPARLRQIQMNY